MPVKASEKNSSAQMAKHLVNAVSDTYLLTIKTQGYHWNVEGPLFPQLHLLFETQYNQLFEAADTIAERIRALGYPAPGSAQTFHMHTAVKEAANQNLSAAAMVKDLIKTHEQVRARIEEGRAFASEIGDAGSEDLLIARLREHDKTIWMLRAQVA